jgi:hypothetical protein
VAPVRFAMNLMIQVRWIESSSITTHSGHTALRRKLGETMFLPTLILLIVLAPVLLPAIITVVHWLTGPSAASHPGPRRG